MKIESNYNLKEVDTFRFVELDIGDIFSFDDCSGLFIVTGLHEAFDFKNEKIEMFDDKETVIRRRIKITTIDGLPVLE